MLGLKPEQIHSASIKYCHRMYVDIGVGRRIVKKLVSMVRKHSLNLS